MLDECSANVRTPFDIRMPRCLRLNVNYFIVWFFWYSGKCGERGVLSGMWSMLTLGESPQSLPEPHMGSRHMPQSEPQQTRRCVPNSFIEWQTFWWIHGLLQMLTLWGVVTCLHTPFHRKCVSKNSHKMAKNWLFFAHNSVTCRPLYHSKVGDVCQTALLNGKLLVFEECGQCWLLRCGILSTASQSGRTL